MPAIGRRSTVSTAPRLALAALLVGGGWASAQENTASGAEVWVDHEAASVVVAALTPLDSQLSFPAARARAARRAAAAAPAQFQVFAADYPLDSERTIGDAIAVDSHLFEQLASFAARPQLYLATLDRRLAALRTEYRYPLTSQGLALPDGRPLIDLFVSHTRTNEPRTVLGFHPSRSFTGVLIFVAGELPARAKLGDRPLQPALLPTVYDADLDIVYSSTMVAPEALRRWGMVRYAQRLDDTSYLPRIGVLPLQVMARGLYGELDTDIIIPNQAARTLLADPTNHQLLREGRVVVVIAPNDAAADQDAAADPAAGAAP